MSMIEEKKAAPHFNKEAEYDRVITPLLELLRALCVRHDIPFVFGAVVKSDGKGMVIATACQQTADGWAPTELRLARSMLLGDMTLVGAGRSSDLLRKIVEHMASQMTEPESGEN
jgi:hypothetical protein